MDGKLKVDVIAGKGSYRIPKHSFENIPKDKMEVVTGYFDGGHVEMREKVQHSLHYVASEFAKHNDASVYLAQKRGNSFFGEKYNMYQVVLGRKIDDEHEIIADIWLKISDGSEHGE